jgi:hypothetical protein
MGLIPPITPEEIAATDWTEIDVDMRGNTIYRSGRTGREIKEPVPSPEVQVAAMRSWRAQEERRNAPRKILRLRGMH